jgi:hypothetical protein
MHFISQYYSTQNNLQNAQHLVRTQYMFTAKHAVALQMIGKLPSVGRDSTVGIVPGWSGDRIPVGMRFSTPIQSDPGAYPASYTMGTGFFPGVKPPGCGIDHSHHLAHRLKKE